MGPSQFHLGKLLVQMAKHCQNPAFTEWFDRDQALLSWINAMLSYSALSYIFGKDTAKDAWDSLEQRYDSLSRSHIIELKKRLQHVKKGASSMQEYLHQLKVIADQLATCGAPVSEEDLILYTLACPLCIGHFKPPFVLGHANILSPW
ncbi:hypothetical protein MRB53_018907 [Persea americana]|uniref:Uncharacterized protein n=1 Tax=Persea americana TaxID=3435 RepID=A0ACC2M9Y1_PERAE|nr:hypothetical protein MRB53_018907 [Persea americana]